jgi:hypothetical protein
MNKKSLKIQTPLRFNKELLELVKEKAKAEKRSLNNYIEYLLYQDVGHIPNSKTVHAIEEARSKKDLESIDDLTSWLEKI